MQKYTQSSKKSSKNKPKSLKTLFIICGLSMGIIFFFDMPVNSFFIVILMGTHEVSHPKNKKEKKEKKN